MPSVAPTPTARSSSDPRTRRIAPRRETDPGRPTLPPGYEPAAEPSGNGVSSNGSASARRASPPRGTVSLPVRLWRIVKSIYYASSPAWQFLKSGALFLLGLFFWSSANLLLSYEPSWHWPYFFMAYGFLLTPYGPFTHLVLVPHVIPWLRRRPRSSWLHTLGGHLTATSLTLFFSAVLWMGLFPPSVMQIDFRAAGAAETVDVNPTLTCERPPAGERDAIGCRLEQIDGVGSVTVESGSRRLLHRTTPPFSFTLQSEDLVEVVGQRQFQVVVYDEADNPVRRFNKTIPGSG